MATWKFQTYLLKKTSQPQEYCQSGNFDVNIRDAFRSWGYYDQPYTLAVDCQAKYKVHHKKFSVDLRTL